ncbi:hypothetical protein IAD21_05216 [Abditibacteriota bacterium]|nr:hypothetical protein IAD21_05216 [Abditibacteriota bacterium]
MLLLWGLSARAETMRSGFLMSGTRYQTPYFIKEGEKSGPTIVVVGGVHGDEVAGYQAARLLKSWRVEEGTLVLVPEAHIEAIRRNVRAYPRNMNRLFPGKANGDAMEKLAFEIWTLIKTSKPQLLLTLHESRGFYVQDRARYGQTFTFDFDELKPQFAKIAETVNASIEPPLYKFQIKVEAFDTCPTYCAWKWLHVPATSIETTRTLPLPLRIAMQLNACDAFFDSYGLRVVRPK